MESGAALSSFVATQGVFRALELALHLYAFLFPKQAQVQDNSCYDFIVVGAGSAGCLLASRLSDNKNFNVLLIEAGGNPTLEVMWPGLMLQNLNSQYDWNYTTVNDNHAFQCNKKKVFPTTRGYGLGGSSAVNAMMYCRGDPYDFDQWADIANDITWNYENVLPFFKKGERLEDAEILKSKYRRFHGTKGEMGIIKKSDLKLMKYMNALKEVGYKSVLDTNGDNTLGFTFPMFNAAQGVRQSSCYCYISPVRNRKNLHVLRNTRVTKVIIEEDRAVGVEIITNHKTKMTLKANLEVILSAGAFNSPQLLMLSGIGPKEHLESFDIPVQVDLPVGQDLQDHIGVIIAHVVTDKVDDTPTNPFDPALQSVNGFVTIHENQTYPDAQFILVPSNIPKMSQFIGNGFKLEDEIIQAAYKTAKEKEVLFNFIYNLRPLSRGYVLLGSTDPTDPPKIYLGAFSNEKDVENMIRYIKDYLRIEKSKYFKRNTRRLDLAGDRCKGFVRDSDEYWKCYSMCIMFSIFHYSGTCAMGSVVDSRLRVLGVRSLRVVDASIFPTVPSANTNAATMMVAEKAAHMIKEDYYN